MFFTKSMQIQDLNELEQQSIKRKIPILGREKGQWLLDFIKEHNPQRILELGTANGYSGIILGSIQAELTTIELNDNIATEAMQNFVTHDINAQILIGDGVLLTKDLAQKPGNAQSFDLIFIDFAKKGYMQVLEPCLTLLKKGGFLIADNITMEKCADFKQAVLTDKRLQTEIIDIKDGLSCSKYVG